MLGEQLVRVQHTVMSSASAGEVGSVAHQGLSSNICKILYIIFQSEIATAALRKGSPEAMAVMPADLCCRS